MHLEGLRSLQDERMSEICLRDRCFLLLTG